MPSTKSRAASSGAGLVPAPKPRGRLRGWAIASAVLAVGFLGALASGLYFYYSLEIPDHLQLANYEAPQATLVDSDDGQRLAEYATEKRVFVPIETVPKIVTQAFLAAEDKNFYTHSGVDVWAIARAMAQNLLHWGENRRPIGASTITQQVAKRFFLTNEVSFKRKLKEAILAVRMERDLSKERILELYLNDIYLGRGAYGVATAAQTYFGKPLDALGPQEAAFLAALPKAPNNYDPARFPEAAEARRDWVLGQMARAGDISDDEAEQAAKLPLAIKDGIGAEYFRAGYFTEEVRRQLVARFGETALYAGGLTVHTTLDSEMQAQAERALRAGLIAYDRRHGWRGRLAKFEFAPNEPEPSWLPRLAAQTVPPGAGQWKLAVVLATDESGAAIVTAQGTAGRIPMAELKWARPTLKDQKIGAAPRRPSDVLARGDLILVEPATGPAEGRGTYPEGSFALRQIPEISGAIVAMDPHTGGVFAMSGGFQFERNRDEFNRATQARRQPGSAFKPFVYLAALNSGFTPSTLVSDGPLSPAQSARLGNWQPSNYDGTSLGMRPLRVGLEHSRNLMTVRVAERIGIERIVDTAERFGIADNMPPDLSMALGSAETTLLRLTTAYAQLANGGTRIVPSLVDWVRNRRGDVIFDRNTLAAAPDEEPIDDPRSIYQVVTMLRGVVERGTGTRARVLGKVVAGKTGTTNDEKDTWFIGLTPDLVCGVFVGFDQPRTLGPGEQGASVALPIFVDFMKEALKILPAQPFPVPEGLVMARVRDSDGLLAEPGENALAQPFKTGTVPPRPAPPPDDSSAEPPAASRVLFGGR